MNALTSSVLTKYAEWDRYSEKFGFVSLSRESVRSLLGEIDDEKLEGLGKELGGVMTRDLTLQVFKRMSVETYLSSLRLLSKYSNLAEYDAETAGRDYVVTVHHQLGRKWSIWLKPFISEGVKRAIGVTPQFEVGDKSLVFRFSVPS
jgi:hypothetical protein